MSSRPLKKTQLLAQQKKGMRKFNIADFRDFELPDFRIPTKQTVCRAEKRWTSQSQKYNVNPYVAPIL